MAGSFRHTDLKLVEPPFASPLTSLIIDLDVLRSRRYSGTTHPMIFEQLKKLFHSLESLGSARIEGNNTTIAEYIESKIAPPEKLLPTILEIRNMEEAMDFIERNAKLEEIDRKFIAELHRLVVQNLSPPPDGEGDRSPGEYRKGNVRIAQAGHVPPDGTHVEEYMEELFMWIGKQGESKYDLLKTALAHHRFVWIHPFANGNGRTVRLLTYAMLIKQGFNVDSGRILNPTAVFCADRTSYYRHLEMADSGTEEGVLAWCGYVLSGLKAEIEKIDRLLDYENLKLGVLYPAITISEERKLITSDEAKILRVTIERQVAKSADFEEVVSFKHKTDISRMINKLKEKKMLTPLGENGRKYVICFNNNYLLRGVVQALSERGFLPLPLNR